MLHLFTRQGRMMPPVEVARDVMCVHVYVTFVTRVLTNVTVYI